MVNFVAALFLPQTLGFVPTEGPEPDAKEKASYQSFSIPNLLDTFASRAPSNVPTRRDTPISASTPPRTPPRSRLVSPDEISARSQQDDGGINSLSARLQQVTIDPAGARSRRNINLTIPQSRASSPPAAALVPTRPAFSRSASTRPPEHVQGDNVKADNVRKMIPLTPVNPVYSNAKYQTFDQTKGNGSLRNAINAAYNAGIIDQPLWVGLPGIPGDEIDTVTKSKIRKDFEERLNSLVVDVSDDTARQGYEHYCKRILWPIFHYQIPDSPKTKIYEEQSYRSVVLIDFVKLADFP